MLYYRRIPSNHSESYNLILVPASCLLCKNNPLPNPFKPLGKWLSWNDIRLFLSFYGQVSCRKLLAGVLGNKSARLWSYKFVKEGSHCESTVLPMSPLFSESSPTEIQVGSLYSFFFVCVRVSASWMTCRVCGGKSCKGAKKVNGGRLWMRKNQWKNGGVEEKGLREEVIWAVCFIVLHMIARPRLQRNEEECRVG